MGRRALSHAEGMLSITARVRLEIQDGLISPSARVRLLGADDRQQRISRVTRQSQRLAKRTE